MKHGPKKERQIISNTNVLHLSCFYENKKEDVFVMLDMSSSMIDMMDIQFPI